jgi:D-arabinose 1-dehydrogenase-like Zn-dependent alcohol dehydrogenase
MARWGPLGGARTSWRDLGEATRLVGVAKIVPRLDHRHFTLETVCNAYRAIKTGSVAGKIVLDVDLLALTGE